MPRQHLRAPPVPDYFIFGGCLQSELEFPELAPANDAAPTWTLRTGVLPPLPASELLAELQPTPRCGMRLTRAGDTYRYWHSCSGTFEIAPDGRTITFDPAPAGRLDIARTDLVARVLLHCVDDGAITWLHGSAVAVNDGAIGFLGPSGAGKSTTALALARAGARHICDDTLPVEAGPVPAVWPSDGTLRLCGDSRRELAPDDDAVRRQSDGKYVLTHAVLGAVTPADGDRRRRSPLEALYILRRAPDEDPAGDAVAERRLVLPRAALPALMQHLKLGLVVRDGTPPRVLAQLGALARSVPVYELRITRDWSRLGELAARLLAWHATEPVGARDP